MKIFSGILIFAISSSVLAKRAQKNEPLARLSGHSTWNHKMYPVWKEGDPRYKDSWTGGQVKFDVSNDAPTLTGARITFTIDILFPANQMALPDGQVVWAKDCTINGTQYYKGEPVYREEESADDWNAVFPDGSALGKAGDQKPPYVFVWKTCGKYWQVSDGPTSSITIETDGVPLGSYMMDVVIYHYRKRDKFIPLGYASTRYSITDQIPFAVKLSQVNDIDEGDEKFVQNRAVAFTVTLHDPSNYLCNSDVTFNWDFGDGSGTVISREVTVTHTYISTGSYKPQVVIQAAIPDPSCAIPNSTPTMPPPTGQPAALITTEREDIQPAEPVLVPTQTALLNPAVGQEHTEPEGEHGSASQGGDGEVATDLPANVKTEVNMIMKLIPANRPVVLPSQRRVLVVEKRNTSEDCVIYRYGSFSTGVEVIEGIEKVEIVHVANGAMDTELEQNPVDITVTCQGSMPTEVCTVVADMDCLVPVRTVCNSVSPSPDCQLVLRHFFNDSGVFCINVSMTNEVSLAAASARVNVSVGSRFTTTGPVAMVLGMLIILCAFGTVALTYKRLKGYHPLTESPAASQSVEAGWSCVPVLLWSLVSKRELGQKRLLPPA